MPLFSSSFKLGPDAPPSAFIHSPAPSEHKEPFDISSSVSPALGTPLPAIVQKVTKDHSGNGDSNGKGNGNGNSNDSGQNTPLSTSARASPLPSRDQPSPSDLSAATSGAFRLQGLGLQHRPSNASDHPFDEDTETEEELEEASSSLGKARRKGSSVSLGTIDLATVQEEDSDEPPVAQNVPRPPSITSSYFTPHHTPPAITSHPASPFSPSPLHAISPAPPSSTTTAHSLQNSPYLSPRSYSAERIESRSASNMDRHSPPSSPGGGGRLRVSASPARHHHGLSALSPLQGLSPMQPISRLPTGHGGHARSTSGSGFADLRDAGRRKDKEEGGSAGDKASERGNLGGHSRTNSASGGSLSRSLSRRQSLYNSAENWREGREYRDENLTNPAGLFSKLTLVKAPGEAKGLTNRQRSKSSSALAPMSLAPFSVTAPVDIPATSPRATRRSFASSFGAMSPITPARPVPAAPSTATDATNRISSYSADAQARGKNYTPDEVLELARSLASPVLVPSGPNALPGGADLKRRKSAGASLGRSYGSNQGLSLSSSVSSAHSPSPENKSAALEPVEYVQLDDETLLPYVDRPTEVKELMAHPGNVKIFDMLRAAFPKEKARQNWKQISPVEWYWDELVLHLTTTDRIECPDYAWVLRARQAIRRRSVALWEKVGICLGCDDRLLQAGSEDLDGGATWGGLGDEEDYEPFRGQVWIEGLSPVDHDEAERAERSFREEFGEIVEDDDAATAGMTALLGTIGEGDEGSGVGSGKNSNKGGIRRNTQTTAQRAGSRYQRDPLASPASNNAPLPGISSGGGAAHAGSPDLVGSFGSASGGKRNPTRSKSFVGLTIHSGSITSPPSFNRSRGLGSSSIGMGMSGMSMSMSRSPIFSPDAEMAMPTYDRGPGQALFPTGFASLSAEPNLGRAASGLVGGIKPQVVPSAFDYMRGGGEGGRLMRRKSGTGLSESAITFASESDWSAGAGHHD